MKEVILIKNGELALKGLNRSSFEDILIKNIKTSLKALGNVNIKKAQSTIMVEPVDDNFDFEGALDRMSKIFGIARFSRAAVCEKNMSEIIKKTITYLESNLNDIKTFKIEAKRSDKKFEHTSPEICSIVGSALLQAYPHLKVDVHTPDCTIIIEIRDYAAYIHCEQIKGAGGMPVGTGGNSAILISGGIDSPVAAWMMAKRGLKLCAIHFASPPYTSARAELKVKKLLSKVAIYSGPIKLITVPFTKIQEEISEKCPEEFFTLIMRRFMMKISEIIALKNKNLALITGESLGQVASQTLPALNVTNSVVSLPVLRPLIGMDKDEIINIARKINTFEISIEPYEDCCTVFTPSHPKTRPNLEQCDSAQSALDWDFLINDAIKNSVWEYIE